MTSLNEFRLNDYIQHMLQAIQRIGEYIEEHTEDYFLKTPILQDAVVRNIEILGEASNNLFSKDLPDLQKQLNAIKVSLTP